MNVNLHEIMQKMSNNTCAAEMRAMQGERV